MNLIKKNVFVVTALLSLACSPCVSFCEAQDEDFEAYFNGLGSDPEFDNVDPASATKSLTPDDIVTLLVKFGIVSILQEDLFLRTSPLNKRNILDQPMGALDRHYKYDDWILGGNFFYNEMNRCYLSQHCDNITCYLGITQESFLKKLDHTLSEVSNFSKLPFDPLNALLLLQNGTVQERQAGLLFFGEKQLPTWDITWKLPFYYLERNYWLTEKEQEAMEAEFGSGTQDQKDFLQHNYLVADKVGFGDFRLAADTELFDYNDDRFNFRIGGQVTVPTAFAITKGIMGNSFNLCQRKQNLDFADLTGYHMDELVNMIIDEDGNPDKAFTLLKNVGICALNGVSAQLLEAPLGNAGHFGIGAYTKSRIPISVFLHRRWAQRITYKGGMSLEYLFPKTEKRMYVERENPAAFDSRNFDDPNQAYDNMLFLERQIVDKLFPFVYNTTVHPGIIFRWLGSLSYESYHWIFNVGTDTWIRSPEALTCIQAPKDQIERLEVWKANRLMGYQWKVLGSLGYKAQRKNHTWIFSIDGDYAWSHSGIGSDYTVSFNVEVDF